MRLPRRSRPQLQLRPQQFSFCRVTPCPACPCYAPRPRRQYEPVGCTWDSSHCSSQSPILRRYARKRIALWIDDDNADIGQELQTAQNVRRNFDNDTSRGSLTLKLQTHCRHLGNRGNRHVNIIQRIKRPDTQSQGSALVGRSQSMMH